MRAFFLRVDAAAVTLKSGSVLGDPLLEDIEELRERDWISAMRLVYEHMIAVELASLWMRH